MCKCTPHKRTPFCGAPGCEWPNEFEVTPEMTEAGAHALSGRFFDLQDGFEYSQIARTVFLAMLTARRQPPHVKPYFDSIAVGTFFSLDRDW
jgi:hypothetical protein